MSLRKSRLVTTSLTLLLTIMFLIPLVAQAAEVSPTPNEWRQSRLTLPNTAKPCANLSKGSEIVVGESDGTYLYNLQKNSKTKISTVRVETCSATIGYGYKAEVVSGQPLPQAYSFTLDQPEGAPIAHLPRYINRNQPYFVYTLEFDYQAGENSKNRLWYSQDAGRTWEERGQQFGKNIQSYAANYTNPKAVYATVFVPPTNPQTATQQEYLVYSSQDSGKTWIQGANIKVERGCYGTLASLFTWEGPTSQTVALSTASFCAAIGAVYHYSLSTDGGKTFNKIGEYFRPARVTTEFFDTPKGTLLLKKDFGGDCLLTYLKNDGQPGQPLALPFVCNNTRRDLLEVSIQQHPNNSEVLILTERNNSIATLWISEDSGATWRQLSKAKVNDALTVLTFVGNMPAVAVLDESIKLGQDGLTRNYKSLARLVDTSKTAEVAASTQPDNLYFRETGHNLSGAFKSYWEKNGGLAQFGYPKTEVFREVNPSDGKTYDVQYFERNRFEYHPEHKGTKYEVLLGLLGNQLTESRRAETPFKPIEVRAAVVNPNELFFPETGHTLKAEFKKYWEANGGLAMYGYPISEQFEEVSADDGKTYVVQYFERNRFEYHPENKGTKYEVLLGLLGNTLMIQKAWL